MPFDLIEPDGIHEIASSQEQAELAKIQLGYKNLLEARENFAQVLGERIQVAKMHARYGFASRLHRLHSGGDCSVGPSPANHEHFAFRLSKHLDFGNEIRDAGNLLGSQPNHEFVVVGI